jgi:HEAT repeats/Thioredoxin domain
MPAPTPPDALLLLATHCPNCPVVLASLAEMVKRGVLGRLNVINLEQHPEAAAEHGVRSVPWVRIGPFELTGLRSRQELEDWAGKAGEETAMADYFHVLLKEGDLAGVLDRVHREPPALSALLPIVANPEASLNVRIGAGAVLEEFAGQSALADLLPQLGGLSAHPDPRVRADACHYLGLTGNPDAIPFLEARLEDGNGEVREIAQESLDLLAGEPAPAAGVPRGP